VGGGVDEQHAEQHDVSGDTSRLRVVDLKGKFRADLGHLDVVEAVQG